MKRMGKDFSFHIVIVDSVWYKSPVTAEPVPDGMNDRD
jgi:hypothetical protein